MAEVCKYSEGTYWDGYEIGKAEGFEKGKRAEFVDISANHLLLTKEQIESYRIEVIDNFLEFVSKNDKESLSVLAERFLTEEKNNE